MSNNEYDLSPDKKVYDSLKSDVSPIDAIKELVDNALDNWKRGAKSESSEAKIEIECDFDNSLLNIKDDTGGISDSRIVDLFALGQSGVSDVQRPIGAYGMGAKKAIVRLGQKATIKSRVPSAERGYGFTVDEEWLNKPEWTVDKKYFDDITPGSTSIEIEDLQIDFNTDQEEEETSRFSGPEEFIEAIKAELSETYEDFLRGRAISTGDKIQIVVNGDKVTSPEPPQWSHTQYDGYHVREYTEYQLELSDRKHPVYVDLKVGLLTSGGQDDGGTDVYIQDRKITSRSTSDAGGWGNGYLPNYQPALGRTRFQLRIYTDGETDTLPWDTQKSSVDPYNEVMQEAFNFMRRAGLKYAKARYGPFPGPFTSAYGEESECALEKSPELFDYSTRRHVSRQDHTPNENRTQAQEVKNAVEAHLDSYRINGEKLIEDSLQPGYNARIRQQCERNYEFDIDDCWVIPEEAEQYSESELYTWLDEVDKLAQRHVSTGVELSESLEYWWLSYYKLRHQLHASGSGGFESTENTSNISESVQTRISAGETPSAHLNNALRSSIPEQEENKKEEKDKKEDEEEKKQEGDSNSDNSSADQEENTADEDTGTESISNNEEEPDADSNTSDDGKAVAKKATKDDSENGLKGTDQPAGTQKAEAGTELIVIRTTSDVHQELCERLDVSVEASPEVIGEAFLSRFLELEEKLTESE